MKHLPMTVLGWRCLLNPKNREWHEDHSIDQCPLCGKNHRNYKIISTAYQLYKKEPEVALAILFIFVPLVLITSVLWLPYAPFIKYVGYFIDEDNIVAKYLLSSMPTRWRVLLSAAAYSKATQDVYFLVHVTTCLDMLVVFHSLAGIFLMFTAPIAIFYFIGELMTALSKLQD
jgi:hypothetical protein